MPFANPSCCCLQLHAIRAGEVKLPLRNHIVVLHWNQQALSLLKQLSHAQADRHSRLYQKPIVVLAEPSKASLDSAVAAVLKGSKHLRLFYRSGPPAKARDLELVAAEAADTVIVLHPESCSSKAAADALKVTALVSLTCLREQVLGHSATARTNNSSRSACTASLLEAVSAAAQAVWTSSSRLPQLLCSISRANSCSLNSSSNRNTNSSNDSMRIVVQMASGRPCSQPDVVGFLQDATATCLYSGKIQQVQLLSQRTLDK
jgi:hypothetical protein